MAIMIPKSEALLAKEAAGKAAIAAKYGETVAPDINANPNPKAALPVEPGMFERAILQEAEAAAKVAADAVKAVTEVTAPVVKTEDKPPAEKALVAPPVADPSLAALVARVAELSDKVAGYEKADRKAAAPVKTGPVTITEEEWNRDPIAAMAKLKWNEERMAQHLLVKTADHTKLDPRIIANVMNDRTNGDLMARINELTATVASMKDESKRERYDMSLEKNVAGVEAEKYPRVAKAKAKNAEFLAKRVRAAVTALRTENPDSDPDADAVMKTVEQELAGYADLFDNGGTTESQKTVEKLADKTDDAPALTATNVRSSLANRGPAPAWDAANASIIAQLKAKYERTV